MSDKILAGVGIVAGVMGFMPCLMIMLNISGEHNAAIAVGNLFTSLMGWK